MTETHICITRSSFRMLQPSDYRDAELNEAWDEVAVRNSRKPVERDTNPNTNPPSNATKHPRRWNPNPSPAGFLEEFPHERFRSIFGGQTEEQMAAELADTPRMPQKPNAVCRIVLCQLWGKEYWSTG